MLSQDELEQQVLLLTSRDWNTRRKARGALISSGSNGIAAVLRGLDNAEPRVRRCCLDFLDHHADELCIDDLRRLALHDPIPHVRRFALHALSCVRCKTKPLNADLVDLVAAVAARSDENVKVRREAIYMLGQLPKGSQTVAVLKQVLGQEPDDRLRKAAHRVRRLHDPEYRRLTDQRARQASLTRRMARGA